MESFYLIIVGCLVLLAVSDLIVGVSNDAVNFLNSAFGSKVASRKTILIVATAGILFGALSSSGMMEVARKGIFNPEMFSFADIMTIFLAVMITDILLLDLFNTFGMPTSTTVSIMFELLGAAFAISILSILRQGSELSALGDYLNTDNAILIIAGIFLSVFIAFTLGLFVQYVTRLIFSFQLDKSLSKIGPFFGGLAITAITYFLLIKGMKGASFISAETLKWISANTLTILTVSFVSWTSVSFLLAKVFKLNVLKLIVLTGTFSLAMAFAGNDLVNFIGVPLAGLQSFDIFQGSGVGAEELNMSVLSQPIQTNTWILLLAGAIMIITLWFSKKARSVTETEINLARQSEGSERFSPNIISRAIVSVGLRVGKANERVLSKNLRKKIDRRFENNSGAALKDEEPAFDLLRAAVNLMMASLLIAFATSLKLPLSTTYVSFMVAMGTSLADRAWDRDSAVYRVAGVVNVIGGWLFTALIAFIASGVLALTIHFGGMVAIIGLMLLTGYLIIRSQFLHTKRTQKQKTALNNERRISGSDVFDESKYHVSVTIFKLSYVLKDLIKGLGSQDKAVIQKAKEEVIQYRSQSQEMQEGFYTFLRKVDSEDGLEGQFYLHTLNHLQNISQSLELVSDRIFNHIQNFHKPIQQKKLDELTLLTHEMTQFFLDFSELMMDEDDELHEKLEKQVAQIEALLNTGEQAQIKRVKAEKSSPKNSMLYITILLEYRDVLMDVNGLIGMYIDESAPPSISAVNQPPVLN